MSRFILIGVAGDPSLTLIDLESKSIETIAPGSVDDAIAEVRAAGGTVFRGVDVAIAIEDRADPVGRFFFDGGSTR